MKLFGLSVSLALVALIVSFDSVSALNRRVKITDFPELTSEKCRMKDPKKVEAILNNLINGGTMNLQLISDFDHTISRQGSVNGRKCLSTFDMFDSSTILPESYKVMSKAIFDKFRPIEQDPTLPQDFKDASEVEWRQLTSDNLKGFAYPQSEIDKVAGNQVTCIREGTKKLMQTLDQQKIPTLVFSAGLGNTVISAMKQAMVYYPSVKVAANFLNYTDGDILNGLKDPAFYPFNKFVGSLKGSEYYESVQNRGNIIVLGDSLLDASMTKGVPLEKNVLKIGFLYGQIDLKLEKYLNNFDVVLIDDQTMNLANRILAKVTGFNRRIPSRAPITSHYLPSA